MNRPGEKTYRVLTAEPMRIVRRYVLAFFGGFLAMGGHIYVSYGRDAWLSPHRLGTACAAGLIFGVVVGFMVVFAGEYPARLRGIWTFPARLILALTAGIIPGTLAWFAFAYLILWIEAPDWTALLSGGTGLSAGFVVRGLSGEQSNRRSVSLPRQHLAWTVLTAALIYLPIYITFQNYVATLYHRPPAMALLYYSPGRTYMLYLVGIPFALCIAAFGQWSHGSAIAPGHD